MADNPQVRLAQQLLAVALQGVTPTSAALSADRAMQLAQTVALISIAESLHEMNEQGLG
jgi:hypothetical protein